MYSHNFLRPDPGLVGAQTGLRGMCCCVWIGMLMSDLPAPSIILCNKSYSNYECVCLVPTGGFYCESNAAETRLHANPLLASQSSLFYILDSRIQGHPHSMRCFFSAGSVAVSSSVDATGVAGTGPAAAIPTSLARLRDSSFSKTALRIFKCERSASVAMLINPRTVIQ